MIKSPITSSPRQPSVFLPPKVILRALPPRARVATMTLHATAQPWQPQPTQPLPPPPMHQTPPPPPPGGLHAPAPLHMHPHHMYQHPPPVHPAQRQSHNFGIPAPPQPVHTTPPMTSTVAPSHPPALSMGVAPSALQPPGYNEFAGRPGGMKPPMALNAEEPMMQQLPPAAATPPSTPPRPKVVISEQSMESGLYTFEELLSLYDCVNGASDRIMRWCATIWASIAASQAEVPKQVRKLLEDTNDRGGLLGSCAKPSSRRVFAKNNEIHHKVMTVLNLVTPQKFEQLKQDLLMLPLKQTDEDQLRAVVNVFFQKAVKEETFSELYAKLVGAICTCTEEDKELPKDEREKLLPFRMRQKLLTRCQEEFNRPFEMTNEDKFDENGNPRTPEELEEEQVRLKKRLCGNIKFVGELYKLSLVTERVIESIFEALVGSYDSEMPKADYVYEVFVTLMKVAARKCSGTRPDIVTKYMDIAKQIELSHHSNRIRFLMMSLVEAQQKEWVPKDTLMTAEERERKQLHEEMRQKEEIDRILKQKEAEKSSSRLSLSSSSLEKRSTRHPHGTPTTSATPQKKQFPAVAPLPQASSPSSSTSLANATSPPKYKLGKHLLQHSSSSGSSFDRIDSEECLTPGGTPQHVPATPPSPASPPPRIAPIVDANFSRVAVSKTPEKDFLEFYTPLNRRGRVSLLTLWIREAITKSKNITAREQLPKIMATFVDSDTLSAVLEWIRYDVERGQYDNCPRFFCNWAECVKAAADYAGKHHSSDASKAVAIGPLGVGTFNAMLRDTIFQEGTRYVYNFMKLVYPIYHSVVSSGVYDTVAAGDMTKSLGIVFNRLRLLPALLQGDGRKSRVRTPTTPGSEGASTDPLSTCLGNQLICADVELSLYKRIMRQEDWKQHLESVLTQFAGAQGPVAFAITLMKAVGTLLMGSQVLVGFSPALSATELDEGAALVLRFSCGERSVLMHAAIVCEVISFFTYSMKSGDERAASKEKIDSLKQILQRWHALAAHPLKVRAALDLISQSANDAVSEASIPGMVQKLHDWLTESSLYLSVVMQELAACNAFKHRSTEKD